MLSIDFVDFWDGFDKEHNYFMDLLRTNYEVKISATPELVFFSCFGDDYLSYDCMRIFFTAENRRSDFTACDFSISFESLKDKRQYKLPYFAYKILASKQSFSLFRSLSIENAKTILKEKNKFAALVVSNGKAKDRIAFFNKLNKEKRVDSGGRFMNTIGGPVKDKLAFIQDYRFVICYENTNHPGYLTEKILDAFLVNAIPIYWGDPLIGNTFNPKAFLNRADFENDEALINEILRIDQDQDLAIKMIAQNKFVEPLPTFLDENNIKRFLFSCVESSSSTLPVAKTFKGRFHKMKKNSRIYRSVRYRLKNGMK